MRTPRWLLFGAAMASLLLMTYAGVLLAFSVEVTPEMAAANPEARAGSRAIVVPINDPTLVPTREAGVEPALLLHGESASAFPNSAKDVRMGAALAHVPAGANGTLEVANATLDLAEFSGGKEGWVVMGATEDAPWFLSIDQSAWTVVRFESAALLATLLAVGVAGFVSPLALVVLTHRGGSRAGAPAILCRECRGPLTPGAEFCVRCGAFQSTEAPRDA